MSWSSVASFAKTALTKAQKQIDKALDIQEEGDSTGATTTTSTALPEGVDGDNGAGAGVVSVRKPPGVATSREAELNKIVQLEESDSDGVTVVEGAFYDNRNAHEMITVAPRARASSTSSSNVMCVTPAPATATAPVTNAGVGLKRKSVTSNSDSVELLSPPTTPCSELASPSEVELANNSESVEVITATTSDMLSPESGASLPESIVIIASNEACDDEEEDSISYKTVTDNMVNATASTATLTLYKSQSGSGEDATSVLLADDALSSSGGAASHSSRSAKAARLNTTAEDTQNIDSDSTQSFEDVQMMQISGMQSVAKDLKFSICSADKLGSVKSASTQPYCSPPNSNDEMETTTSSDIEIISNPNGDSSSTNSTTRTSPMKTKKLCSNRAPAVPAKKGHCREPSEISILSEDSQSEIDKLMQRISELNGILEAREMRLLQSERQNSALLDQNNELQTALNALKRNISNQDSAGEYTQRLSALEKKFQVSIQERDSLRMQIKALKDELQNKIPKDELNAVVTESNAMIAELRLEGEKLSKEILQQSNIIKKLRAKEKQSDSLLKKNKEQIDSMLDEQERLKKSLNAKEEVERMQIEAVHKMSAEKRKLEEENAKQRSQLEDLQAQYASLQVRFDAVSAQMQQRNTLQCDFKRSSEEAQQAHKERDLARVENLELKVQLRELREQLRVSEQTMMRQEQQLREQNKQLLMRLEAAELRAETSTQEVSLTTIPLVRQLDALQTTLSQRTSNWNREEKMLLAKIETLQTRLKSMEEIEATCKDKNDLLQARCVTLEEKMAHAAMKEEQLKVAQQDAQLEHNLQTTNLNRQITTLNETLSASKTQITALEAANKSYQERVAKIEANNSRAQQLAGNGDDFLFRELTASAISETSPLESSQRRARSPAISSDRNSVEEAALGAHIDWQADDLDCISNSGRQAGSLLNYGAHVGLMGHSTSTLEHLQSLLKQRDGEHTHLQWELTRLQAERSVLNEEISSITLELENLKDKLATYDTLERQYSDLQHRYDALLQMYGEKVERTEELELDLVELKEAYKEQITELLGQAARK